MRSLHRFPLFDRTGEYDDYREVIDQPTILEPHDDRTDQCVSVPVRSVISATAGPAVEIGPFNGHQLAGENLIIKRRANGRTIRNCRTCQRAAQRRAYRRSAARAVSA